MKKLLLMLVFALLLGITAFAQDASFTAAVSKTTIGLGENFQLTFTLQNGDAHNFRAPSLNDFSILSGPNQGTSMSFVNGVTSRSISFSYILQPKAVGKFTIGSAVIEAGGKVFNSNKIPIEVVKGSAPTQGSNGKQGGNNGGNQSIQDQLKEVLFLRANVDKTEIYQGEQITATYKLYSRLQGPLANTNINKMPAFSGFWSQDLENIQNLNYQNDTWNGVNFKSAVIKKSALFAQHAGELELDALGMTSIVRVQAQRQSRSMWDDFFGNFQDVKYDYESNRIKIKVKPLPTANKPLDFSGFVGELSMDVVLDKKEGKTDDPITVSVRFNGKGNLKVIEAPKIDLPNDFDIFDPKMTEKPNKASAVVSGGRNYDFLVIPRRPGTFKLPPITVSYFDPNSGTYKTLRSSEFTLNITGAPSKSAGTQNTNAVAKEDVQLLGQDIRYINTNNGGMHKKEGYFFGSLAFAALYLAPLALFFALLVYRRRKDEMDKDTVQVRKRGATKAATKRLKAAKERMDARDTKGYYDELIKAIWGYMGDKLNIEPSVLSHDTAKDALLARKVEPELINRIFRFISDSEMALYAPGAMGGTMESHYNEAKEIIDRLEEELGK